VEPRILRARRCAEAADNDGMAVIGMVLGDHSGLSRRGSGLEWIALALGAEVDADTFAFVANR
jgi:hypothetical protein